MANQVPPASTSASSSAGKTSPWLWAGLGCGGVLLLIVIVGIAGCFVAARKLKDFAGEMEKNPAIATARAVVRFNPDLEEVSSDAEAGTMTIRNRKTGETVTMNAAEIEQGRFTFSDTEGKEITIEGGGAETGGFRVQTPDGTFTMQADGGELPEWVPGYPGATDRQVWAMSGPDGASGGMTFSVADTAEAVMARYEADLKQAGFEVSTSSFQQDGRTQGGMLNAVDRGAGRQVTVLLATDAGRAQVTVNYGPHK